MLRFERFAALSFDCYGTLIDWETGILEALRPLLRRHGVFAEDDRLLELYAAAESEIEAGPYVPYRDVLREVVRRLSRSLAFRAGSQELDALAASLPGWPPFPDTIEALRALAGRFRLAIVSNVDDDLFAGTQKRLGVEFALVTTAEQVRSYKPAPAHFERMLARLEPLGIGSDRLLHVAQSLFHDVAPAKALGLATVWVNRRAGRRSGGATPRFEVKPDLEVKDLATLASLVATSPS